MALLLFVGIPLPGTGAWTGTLAASLLDMDFKSSVIAVMCGVVLAGVIMGLLQHGSIRRIGDYFLKKLEMLQLWRIRKKSIQTLQEYMTN